MNNPDQKSRLGQVSVVIPVGPGDLTWQALLKDLTGLPAVREVILAGCEPEPPDLSRSLSETGPAFSAFWVQAQRSRATQLNTGAGTAGGRWLWFLHADSRLESGWHQPLSRFIERDPSRVLGYGHLAFASDGPRLTRLNAWGANLRSRLFRLPFGDQGLVLSRSDFEALGGFNEDFLPGEDLDLVRRARQAGYSIRPLGLTVTTSARRFREQGWCKTTWRNLWLTPVLVRRSNQARHRGTRGHRNP